MALRRRHIDAFRCPRGPLYLHPHERCPHCDGALTPVRVSAGAILVSHTTVRVNPTDKPFRLGVAVAECGAATLCVVEGRVRGNGRERVRLELRAGRYYAVTVTARTSRRREPPTTHEDLQKS